MRKGKWERGQALVLIVLAIVGIFGFAALAVDAGRLFSERRRAQNAADAAALAAAFSKTYSGSNNPDQAVLNSLSQNGYTSDTNLAVDASLPEDVQYFNPPNRAPYNDPSSAEYADRDNYFQVIIHKKVDQVFSQFIFPDVLNVQVEAISHIKPSGAVSGGNAMTAMGRDTCQGIRWDGGMLTEIEGGDIFSNSSGTGNGNCHSGIADGSSGIIRVATPNAVVLAGDWRNQAGAEVLPGVTPNAAPQVFDPINPPYCDNLPEGAIDTTNHIIQVGKHLNGVRLNGNDAWTMESGLHCFYGDFEVTNGKLTGNGVLIVMMPTLSGNSTSVKITGGDIKLYAPTDLKDLSGQQWNGMLFFMPYENGGALDIGGNSGSTYSGTFWAPGPNETDNTPKCDYGGKNESIGIQSSIMCYTIGISGNSNITIKYQEGQNYRPNPKISLNQ